MKPIDRALIHYREGMKLQDIADKLKVSLGSVKGMLYRNKIADRKPRKQMNVSQERIDRIIQLWMFNDGSSADYSIGEIANEVGLSSETVHEVIRMHKFEKQRDERKGKTKIENS